MTTITRGRPSGKRIQQPVGALRPVLSISANLAFHSSLHSFLEAQKALEAMPDVGTEYAEREYKADIATATLVRSIDAFIERRRSTETITENVSTYTAALPRSAMLRLLSTVPEARQAEISAVIVARVQELFRLRPGALPDDPPSLQMDETWVWAAATHAFLKTRRKALKDEAFGDVELTRVLSADPRTEGGRALRRCYHLLYKLIYKGAKKKGLL